MTASSLPRSRVAGLALALLLAACAPQGPVGPSAPLHTYVNRAGELWAGVGDAPAQRLLTNGQDYRPVPSPDGRWLAVEVRLMSNLDVVRLYRREGTLLVPVAPDITTAAWARVRRDHGIDPEALDGARSHISGWENGGTALWLELSADVESVPQTFHISVPLEP